MATITELNRLLSLPADKVDLGDGRELIVQQWSPSVSNEDHVVNVTVEGMIVFKDGD